MSDALPLSKDAYSYDRTTREYLGPVLVYRSPEDGTYHLPACVVEVVPPANLGPREAARLNAQGDAWEVVPNYRGVMLWDTATGRPVPNTLPLGETPGRGVTAEPPPIVSDAEPIRHVWDSVTQAWIREPDFSRFTVWWKASGEPAPRVPSGQPLPENVTTLCPPTPGPRQALQWNAEHDTWAFVPDYRGVTYWTADGASHVIEHLGELPPAGHLTAPPAEPPATTDSIPTED